LMTFTKHIWRETQAGSEYALIVKRPGLPQPFASDPYGSKGSRLINRGSGDVLKPSSKVNQLTL
jgi:hypothetical protein